MTDNNPIEATNDNDRGPEAFGPYSIARVATGRQIMFISGHCAWDESGAIVGGQDIGDQYRQIMRVIKAIIEDAGGSMGDICKMVNYMAVPFSASGQEYRDVSEARSEFFPEKRFPASTMIQVARLGDPDALVEVDAVAVFD